MSLAAALGEDFFTQRWRQRPVVLRSSASYFLQDAPTLDDVAALVEETALDGAARAGVKTDDESVWFIERVIDQHPATAALVAQARELFEWDDCWCDVVRTIGTSSIGCHYDNSDNFSIQLTGSKRWRISPPAVLPREDLRQRLLREPGVGGVTPPREAESFLVNPGDVLYIPCLWVHWGQALGDSTSVSLVVNARTVHECAVESLVDELRHDAAWLELSAVGPGSTDARRSQVRAAVRQLTEPTLQEAVVGRGVAAQGTASGPALDIERLRELVEVTPDGRDISPEVGLGGRIEDIFREAARIRLRSIIAKATRCLRSTSDPEAVRLLTLSLAALAVRGDAGSDGPGGQPDCVAWSLSAAAGARGEIAARHDAHSLAFSLLADIAAACRDDHDPGVAVRHDPDAEGVHVFGQLGLSLVSLDRPGPLVVEVHGGDIHVNTRSGLEPIAEASDFDVRRLPRVPGTEGELVSLPTWASHLLRPVGGAAPAGASVIDEAAEWLAQAHPDVFPEIAAAVRWIVPTKGPPNLPASDPRTGRLIVVPVTTLRSTAVALTMGAGELVFDACAAVLGLADLVGEPSEGLLALRRAFALSRGVGLGAGADGFVEAAAEAERSGIADDPRLSAAARTFVREVTARSRRWVDAV